MRVGGQKDGVLTAKGRILEILDTKVNRSDHIIGICIFFFFDSAAALKHPSHPSSVTPASNCRIDRLSDRILLKPLFVLFFSRVTIKMDVSYTDHSHIIGKGGNTIRR